MSPEPYDGLNEGQYILIWHKVAYDDVVAYSPLLAAKLAGDTMDNFENLIEELCKAMKG